jgi:Zn-dependent oligopeptidase
LTGEEARFLKKLMLEKQLQGLHLSEAKRNKITQIKTKMSALSLEFAKNLGDEDSKHHFTKEQLAGLPDSFLEGLNKSEDGLFELDLSYPLYVPVMKECSVEATRKHMEKAFNSRCKDTNTAILEQLVTLRHQLAGIIGYSTHAKLTLVRRLAKDPAKVVTFLDDLNNKLSPLANKEMSELLQYKKAEVTEAKATDLEFKSWDWSYYMNQLVKDKYTIDNEAVKQYFPLHVVTKGMMEIYQNLLSLRFVEVENPHVWHEDVQLFNVFEAKVEEGQEQGKFVGQFYLDLYPRKGKYGHAAVWPLISGSTEPDRVRYPVCGMVCNFPKPGDSNPSLLPHNQVVTYFHEFGHVMHGICSQTRFSEFAGTSVERDFVEAPSQMLENWVYEKKALLIMSGHVDDESKKMPEEMIDSLIAAKHANVGLLTKRQLLFGIFDQTIHSADKVDTAKLYGQLHKRILGFSVTPNTNMPASFGHLAGGYDAQYYGYMWSLVFSEDMFQSKFKQDPLSAEQGALYRQHILANGSSVDADVMLERFLGRPPNSDAFLKSKGLHVSSSSTA